MPTRKSLSSRKTLPESTAWLFPEYEFGKMDDEGFANVIVERILERGTWDELRWLFARYGQRRIATWLRQHGFRRLSPRSFEYWLGVFVVKASLRLGGSNLRGYLAGAMHSGESFLGSFTSLETVNAAICEAGYGLSSLSSVVDVCSAGSSHTE